MPHYRIQLASVLLILALSGGMASCQSSGRTDQTQATERTDTTTADSTSQVTFQELYRPQFHFTPPINWMNDPNGLVYYKGLYHLFYQYNPEGIKWGHMSWGHAVSKDLVHWEHLPLAIPEQDGYMIFSGSAIVDENNTSGFSTSTDPKDKSVLVAVYTAHHDSLQTQHLAYSNDQGRTWTQYEGNPIINVNKKDFRDPKVFWYAPSKQWIMAVTLATEKKISLYASLDLKKWSHLSDFGTAGLQGDMWECSDLYELPVTNQPGKKKWVLQLSANKIMQYFIGDFDGRVFKNDNPPSKVLLFDHGPDFFAGITWNNVPASDDRRIGIGWMNSWIYGQEIPTQPWRSAQSVPRLHQLKAYPEGVRLTQQPIRELQQLRGKEYQLTNTTVAAANQWIKEQQINGKTMEVVLEMEPEPTGAAGLLVRKGEGEETAVGYETTKQTMYVDRTRSGKADFSEKFAGKYEVALPPENKAVKLHLLIDWSSVEVFGNDGRQVITCQIFPKPESQGIELFAKNSNAKIKSLTIWPLQSIWTDRSRSVKH